MNRLPLMLLALCCLAPAPSRSHTYTAGNVIEPAEVTTNEDNIYGYLQAGVDTYSAGSVNADAIASSAITNVKMANESVNSANIIDGTIGNADVSSTAAINASKLADNEIDHEELAATLTMSDGDLIDLSAVNASSTSEGLLLPQSTSCSSATAEGQICWDTDNDLLYVGNASSAGIVANGGTPALTLGTSNSAGSATTFIRTDDTLALFDATVPTTAAFGDSAATGSDANAARRDHTHGMPAAPYGDSFYMRWEDAEAGASYADMEFAADGSTITDVTVYKPADLDTLDITICNISSSCPAGGNPNFRLMFGSTACGDLDLACNPSCGTVLNCDVSGEATGEVSVSGQMHSESTAQTAIFFVSLQP